MDVGEFARFSATDDGILNDGYDCAGKSVNPKALQELLWHGEVVEYKKERNQDENERCYGF